MSTQESIEELETPNSTPDLIVITGMSGAGRTEAMHTFEDLGYFCIDNLPPSLLMNLVSLAGLNTGTLRKLAVVCDLRAKEFFPELTSELAKVAEVGLSYSLLFLDSSDEVLLNRYKATRRRHPLCDKGMTIISGIRKERQLLAEAKQMADFVLDTSKGRPQDMRKKIRLLFSHESEEQGLGVSVYSFGFKHGAPMDADIVIDVRFLPNPYYVAELREKDGRDAEVRDFVLEYNSTQEFLRLLGEMIEFLLPQYVEEGKHNLTIAIGCTGGHHRSVVIAESVAGMVRKYGHESVLIHRDVEKG